MSYDHSLSTAATLKEGTTLDNLVAAIRPILDYFGYDRSVFEGCNDNLYCNHEFHWVPESREFSIYTCGEVSTGYGKMVEQAAGLLGPLVDHPNEFLLVDHETGDSDDAKSTIHYGPSVEAISRYVADKAIAEALDMMREHLDVSVMKQIEQLAKSSQPTLKMAAFMGYLTMPDGDTLQLDFTAPVGASQADKDACFMNAFAQVGTIDYLEVGENVVSDGGFGNCHVSQ